MRKGETFDTFGIAKLRQKIGMRNTPIKKFSLTRVIYEKTHTHKFGDHTINLLRLLTLYRLAVLQLVGI